VSRVNGKGPFDVLDITAGVVIAALIVGSLVLGAGVVVRGGRDGFPLIAGIALIVAALAGAVTVIWLATTT
jgi:hypothetical protein